MCRIEDQSTQLGIEGVELEIIQDCASNMLKHISANLERKSGDEQKLRANHDYLSNLLQCCNDVVATS